jgi:hypothetical protein
VTVAQPKPIIWPICYAKIVIVDNVGPDYLTGLYTSSIVEIMAVQARSYGTRSKLDYAADKSPVSPSILRVVFKKSAEQKMNDVTNDGRNRQIHRCHSLGTQK